MHTVTHLPLLRSICAHFHPRYMRMNNRKINKKIFEERRSEFASLEAHLSAHPEDFSRAGLFDAPYYGR